MHQHGKTLTSFKASTMLKQSEHIHKCLFVVDRGSGWVPLAQDSTPGYTDTTPHPATPTKWKYKAIYRVDDAQVGLWSAEVSVVVGG